MTTNLENPFAGLTVPERFELQAMFDARDAQSPTVVETVERPVQAKVAPKGKRYADNGINGIDDLTSFDANYLFDVLPVDSSVTYSLTNVLRDTGTPDYFIKALRGSKLASLAKTDQELAYIARRITKMNLTGKTKRKMAYAHAIAIMHVEGEDVVAMPSMKPVIAQSAIEAAEKREAKQQRRAQLRSLTGKPAFTSGMQVNDKPIRQTSIKDDNGNVYQYATDGTLFKMVTALKVGEYITFGGMSRKQINKAFANQGLHWDSNYTKIDNGQLLRVVTVDGSEIVYNWFNGRANKVQGNEKRITCRFIVRVK